MLNSTYTSRNFILTVTLIVGLILINYQTTNSQGRDRSRYRIFDDTTSVFTDTTTIKDTSIVSAPVDSTARLKYFVYEHKDQPVVNFDVNKSPFLLNRSSSINYKIDFDTANNVTISEFIDDKQVKIPVTISFDKYLELRSKNKEKEIFYDIVEKNFLINTEDDLQQIFKSITDITIPLPFTSETIFGPPNMNLKINGQIDITGSYEKKYTDRVQTLNESQTQNNINFKQEVQVTTKGTVGDKLTIDADWNSQRTFEFENQLKLKYTGYPDEVIQTLEAGNVSLETRSGLIGSTQALFGVKGQFKLGPLKLTALASQKKSEPKTIDITGGTQESIFDLKLKDYSDNHYFIDLNYRDVFEHMYKTGDFTLDSSIYEIEVWAQTESSNPEKVYAIATLDLPPRPVDGYDSTSAFYNTEPEDGQRLSGYFRKLEPSDFSIHRTAGFLTILVNTQTSFSGQDAIAVSYIIKKNNNVSTQYGDMINDRTKDNKKILKIVKYEDLKSPTQNSTHERAWKMKMKNVYSINVRNIQDNPANLKLYIEKRPASTTPLRSYSPLNASYLNLVGLDQRARNIYNDSSTIDGEFDFFSGITIDRANGYVIFPSLEPFWTTLKNNGVSPDSIALNERIYTHSQDDQILDQIQFYIVGSALGESAAKSRYSLGFNLVEGSVQVFNGSVKLTQGVDYTIDYVTGELNILNASALLAGQNLKITFEQNELFQLASKTLIGTRAELEINKTSYLGFTLLNLKQETLNDKVRIGEEPTNNTIIGLDAQTEIKTNFLTKLLNKIPGYNTKEESILNLKGEVAFMMPDPNTKKSLIPSDNGESVAYIDDFEGSKKVVPLGTSPISWIVSSIPIDTTITNHIDPTQRDSLMSLRRAKLEWFSFANGVPITDVYPDRNIANNQNQNLSPLVLKIKPNEVGPFNYITQDQFNTIGSNQDKWAGFFKFLNTSQTNLVNENINFIEIWMKVEDNPGVNATMVIDLGLISEKIITDSKMKPRSDITNPTRDFHTEDLNDDGLLQAEEDVGLDGYPNNMEITQHPELGNDPSRDNYSWINGDYENTTQFNGSEQNYVLDPRIDTEDLNRNGRLDLSNNYRRYEVSIDPAQFNNNKYIAGGGNKGWYQFLIPLDQYTHLQGEQNLTNVKYARMYFKNLANETVISIVDMNLVGNQWVKTDKSDTTYSISVVSIEENANIYEPPVGGNVLRQKDQSNVDQDIFLNEQSLSLDVRNLLPGQGKFTYKNFNLRPIDLINYKILKLFVNGDSSFNYINPETHDAEFVVRLGSDSANYYEYRAPLHPDVRPGSPWNPLNEVEINLSDLTSIKQSRDSLNVLRYFDNVNGPPGSRYGILGSPTITGITQIVLGVINSKSNQMFAEPISGSVWFNELRVIKTDNKSGYAFNFNAGLKWADFANLNFSFNRVDPNYHTLENRFGSRILSNSWDISGSINAHKIVNSLLASLISVKLKDFLTIPVTFTHSEVFDRPRFVPATDITLDNAAARTYEKVLLETGRPDIAEYEAEKVRVASQTLRIDNRFAITGMKFNFPEENYFAKELLNKIEFNFYRNSITERTPTKESRYAWDLGGSVGLSSNLDLLDKLHLKIGKFLPFGDEYKDAKMYFFFPFMPLAPLFTNNIALGTSFQRTRGDEKLRTQFNKNPISRSFNANRNFSMDWKFIENWIVDLTGNYSFQAGSDLTYLETYGDSSQIQRPEGEIIDDIFFNKSKGLINFGNDVNSSQVISINPKINIPYLKDFIDITGSYRVQYGWQLSQNQLYGNNVGYNADLQGSAFLKLNQLFNLFKSNNNSGASESQQDQDPGDLFKLLGTFVPDQISVNFNQNKQVSNPGIQGRPGFTNFWMALGSDEDMGPSRFYQLGWVNDAGKRMPNLNINDIFQQVNTLTFNTLINPIFPDNLKINLSYKTVWGKNNTYGYLTDFLGNVGNPLNMNSRRSITRPSFFISGDITRTLVNPVESLPTNVKADQISASFENDVVSMPFPNWSLSLTGVEAFDLFTGFAQSVSIESAFTSEYIKNYYYDGTNIEYLENQSIKTGFSPLFGINMTFKPIEGGNLTATFKLNQANEYRYDRSTFNTIINNATSDYSINANFTKTGFTIPLFGLQLQNDLTIGFSFTRKSNNPQLLKYESGIWQATSQLGTITTNINPSVQYALSKSVSLMLFYNYIKTAPEEGSTVPTNTTNEAGLNIKLTIQ